MRKENPTEYEMLRDLWRTHYFPRNPHAIRDLFNEMVDEAAVKNACTWENWKKCFIFYAKIAAVAAPIAFLGFLIRIFTAK